MKNGCGEEYRDNIKSRRKIFCSKFSEVLYNKLVFNSIFFKKQFFLLTAYFLQNNWSLL